MGRVGGDGDGRGMRKGAQDEEKSDVLGNYLQRLREREMCEEIAPPLQSCARCVLLTASEH